MRTLIITLLVFFYQLAPIRAQYVTIPDPNFVAFLQQNFPSCMNGNQMDTTCSDILSTTQLSIGGGGISDITGVTFFSNLEILGCGYSQLSSIPELPDSLKILLCNGNQLNSLPTLPNSLEQLDCGYNQITSLPNLPTTMTSIYCNHNLLTSLPSLPNSLEHLNCVFNQLVSLPTLPNSIEHLNCAFNQLLSLPTLPNSLVVLDCHQNQLTSLPTLPDSLTYLRCSNNLLSSLPTLSSSLTSLMCQFNQLISLPTLPNSLVVLDCYSNQLSSLSAVPNVMNEFRIENNSISCLINLPEVSFGGVNNPLYVNISGNPVTCVPNQTNYSGNLPLCLENDPVNNPNNCPGVNISGRVYGNDTGNCLYNSGDQNLNNIPVKLYDLQSNFIAESYTQIGIYSFANLSPDTYSVEVDTSNLPILMDCSQNSMQIVTLNSSNQTVPNIDFPVQCNLHYDIWVQSLNTSGWVFPVQMHTLQTSIFNNSNWFNLNCDSSLYSGNVTIQVNGPVTYVSPAPNALTPAVNGNTFTYNISDFAALTPQSFSLRFQTDTTAQAGNQICVHVDINPTPLDSDTANNVYDFCYQVVNSYDPNMKEVYPVNVLPGYDDWFTYTIHFQNTGTAPAFNLRLRDTLDTQLDLSTFEMLGYSHPANISLSENILTIRFNNIMLPDSTTDYEGSMGYFQYRIKPLPNLPNGTQIENTAYIYFDYNAPIVTNTTQNNFDITVGQTSLIESVNRITLYPNPGTGIFYFKDSRGVQSVEVYNLLGEKLLQLGAVNQINLQDQPKGIYLVRVNGIQMARVVKE